MPEKPFPDLPGVSVGLSDRLWDLFVAQGAPEEELALTVEKLAERLLWLEDRTGLVGLSPEWQLDCEDSGPTYWVLKGWAAGYQARDPDKRAWFTYDKGALRTAESLRDAMRAAERALSEAPKAAVP